MLGWRLKYLSLATALVAEGLATIWLFVQVVAIGYPRETQLEPIVPPQEKSTWEEVQKITGWNPNKVKEVS